MEKQFPRTQVEDVSLSRMIIGTNWLLGWSHTSPAADQLITNRYQTTESFFPVLEAYAAYGIDTIMGPLSQNPIMVDALKYAEDKLGKGFILVDTPIIDVSDNADARRETEALFRKGNEIGAKISLIHHSSVEQLVNKNLHRIVRLEDYTKMIRDHHMIPGLSAHMPELITYSDENEYDVQTYIQLYNCMGFLMQVEIETVASIIQNAKKPVMTIKSMAAGRCSPYVGITFAYSTLRPCDMVTIGAFDANEVHEDVEIAMAAIERRFPNIGKRHSPNEDQAAFGNQ